MHEFVNISYRLQAIVQAIEATLKSEHLYLLSSELEYGISELLL